MKASTPSRPRTVVIAVLMLAVGLSSVLLFSLQILQRIPPAPLVTLIHAVLSIGFLVMGGVLVAIWRGHNWARWVCALMVVMGLARALPALLAVESTSVQLLGLLPLLLHVGGASLLFARSSIPWFVRRA